MASVETFGVEIEAKVDGYSYQDICNELECKGVTCLNHGYNHTDYHDGVTWKIVSDATVGDNEDDEDGECALCYSERQEYNCEENDYPCDYGDCENCYYWESYRSGATGFELVSPVLKFDEGSFEQVRTVCKVLRNIGAYVDEDCGLHVHHGTDLSDKERKTLVKTFVRYEKALDLFVAPHRSSYNDGCEYSQGMTGVASDHLWASDLPWGGYFDTATEEKYAKAREALRSYDERTRLAALFLATDKLKPNWFQCDRYAKLNMSGLDRRGTIETRMHEGCINADKIIGWATMLKKFFEYATEPRRKPRRTPGTVKSLFRVLKMKPERWMNENARLAA